MNHPLRVYLIPGVRPTAYKIEAESPDYPELYSGRRLGHRADLQLYGSRMNRLATCSTIFLSLVLCGSSATARKQKPILQVYGVNITFTPGAAPTYTAYLILPDGSHAEALCGLECAIEPAQAEKRITIPCDLIRTESIVRGEHPTCYKSEFYEFDRKNNDITLRTVRGKLTYHIYGSW